MARIRTIKPEILEDEKTAALSLEAFKLFVACIILADDYGNLRGSPPHLRAQAFWAQEDVSVAVVESALAELGAARLVARYTVSGQAYVAITNWEKHQRVDNAGKPRVPGPSEAEPAEARGDSPRRAASLGEESETSDSSPRALNLPGDFAAGPRPRPRPRPTTGGGSPPRKVSKAPKTEKRRAEWFVEEAERRGRTGDVSAVVEAYLKHHPRAKPGKLEQGLIAERLIADDFDVSDLCEAIDGCHLPGSWHVQNRHDALKVIVRDSGQVEQFRGKVERAPTAGPSNGSRFEDLDFGAGEASP